MLHRRFYKFGRFRLDAMGRLLFPEAEAVSLPPKAADTLRARTPDLVPNLRYRPEILIQPIQRFLDEFVVRDGVARLELDAFLLVCLRSQQVVERQLG